MAIQSFTDPDTETFFLTGRVTKRAGWQAVARVARRKLDMLHYASLLNDLRSPPGNRLEALRGKLRGRHSIRVNEQWRVVFRWHNTGPTQVQIVDYHE